MKSHIIALLGSLFITVGAYAHGPVELGPNGGRILEFSTNETMHGEVSAKDGKFHIALLDKDMKPVALTNQTLTASTGDRAKPQKLAVEKANGKFVLPLVKPGEWLILQFKGDPKAKVITARVQYDTSKCGDCKTEEWLCLCSSKEAEKKKEKK